MRGNAQTRQRHEGIAPFMRHGYIPFRGAAEAHTVPCAPRAHAQDRFFPLVPGVACMSQSSTSSALPVTTAFLLAQSEDFAVIDRRALREAGIGHVRVLTSGIYAARLLAGKEKNDQGAMPDVVLVQHQLADMTGADFVELARSHPRLAGLPILHISSSETTKEEIEALAQGYSGVLARPYSRENMRLALEYAAAVKRDREKPGTGHTLLDTEFFDKALERAGQPAGEGETERRRMRGHRQRAQAAAKSLFARGVPLLETDGEDEAAPQYRPRSGKPLAIEPLAETSAASDLSGVTPGANDAITVAKMTWKLFRSAKL